MLTVVADDDPTGTQSASAVEVLLDWDAPAIAEVLTHEDAVYLQTNSRAVGAADAARGAAAIRDQLAVVSHQLGRSVLVVLRGDSTLRGHVFTESDVFAGGDGRILFVPGFPAGGRTTIGSVHLARIAGSNIPVGETEFARDPVFGYRSSNLVEWTAEVGKRRAHPVLLSQLRATAGEAVAGALAAAGPREVVVPDVENDRDIELVHAGLLSALAAGTHVVVRAAAPLAALCAGRLSRGYLPRPLRVPRSGVLVVCGSHTAAATAQLQALSTAASAAPVIIPTEAALADPQAAGRAAAQPARPRLAADRLAIIATDRQRLPEHDTLEHAAQVMTALVTASAELIPLVGAVITKGGITSAEVARTGFGARSAWVRGQVAAGISVWDLGPPHRPGLQVIVPGNVGDENTLVDVLSALAPKE